MLKGGDGEAHDATNDGLGHAEDHPALVLFRLVALEPGEEEKEGEEADAGEEDEGFGVRAGFYMEQDGECGEGGDNPDCAESEGPGADAAV